MMKLAYIIGNRLESFRSTDDFRRALSVIRSCGYKGVELNMTGSLLQKIDVLQRWLKEDDLELPSFLTGEAYLDGLCLTSKDAAIRERAVRHLIQCVDAAAELGSIFVVGLLQGTTQDESDRIVAQQRIVEGLGLVAGEAERRSVRFVVEPVNHLQVGFNNSVDEVLELIEQIRSPAVWPMVDTIHMNIEESSMPEAIRKCGNRLAHVHLCETNGGQLGTGHVDFETVLLSLEQVGYRGFGSVKLYRHLGLEEGARTSIHYLRQLPIAATYLS